MFHFHSRIWKIHCNVDYNWRNEVDISKVRLERPVPRHTIWCTKSSVPFVLLFFFWRKNDCRISIYIFDLCFARDKKTSKESRTPEKKVFFLSNFTFYRISQIEYLGSFIPHDPVLNTPVVYDLYFNHKQLLKMQKLIQKLILILNSKSSAVKHGHI